MTTTSARLQSRIRRTPALILALTLITIGGIPAAWFGTTWALIIAIKYWPAVIIGALAVTAIRVATPPADTITRKATSA